MTLTMIAPEYTFWVASGQRSVAKKSLIQLGEYGSWGWTTTHTFYAAMGGFVLVDKEDPEARFPISIEDIIQLLHSKLLPPECVEVLRALRKEEIEDRSKANSFAKALACIQFVWLGLQCSARAAQNLAFTLIELVTVAEAIITIATYIMWWNKPLDVASTTELHITTASTLASATLDPTTFRYNHYELWGPIVPVGTYIHRIRNGFRITSDPEHIAADEHTNESLSANESHYGPFVLNDVPRASASQIAGSPGVQQQDQQPTMTPADRTHHQEADDMDISSIPLHTLSTTRKSSTRGNSISDEDISNIPHAFGGTWHRRATRRSASRSNYYSRRPRAFLEGFRGAFKTTAPFFEASFIAIGFGALHTAAWNFNFPTLIERNLWRISSVVLAISLPLYFLCWIFIKASVGDDAPKHPVELRACVVLICSVYVVARTYTLAESFASLRKQPIGVYEGTKWTLYLPHF
jgi:hypothetical protein